MLGLWSVPGKRSTRMNTFASATGMCAYERSCVWVCVRTCACVRKSSGVQAKACVRLFVHAWTRARVFVSCIHVYVTVHDRVCTCMCEHLHVYVSIWMYVLRCLCTRVCVCVCACTRACLCMNVFQCNPAKVRWSSSSTQLSIASTNKQPIVFLGCHGDVCCSLVQLRELLWCHLLRRLTALTW